MIKTKLPIDKVIKEYLSGKSMTELASTYNVSRFVIEKRLKEHNIQKHKLGFQNIKFNLNERYFDCINSEDKAYFLGLLYADGCNHRGNHKKVSIDLQEDDKDILIKFSEYLYGENRISFLKKRNINHKNQYRLNINNSHISDVLNNYGCTPNKSLTLKFPEWLNSSLYNHFIRGYFDGDGSLYYYMRRNIKDYTLSITSTSDFCDEVSKIINNLFGTHVVKSILSNKITSSIKIRGKYQILKFVDWLYLESNIYLNRKYNKYLEFKNIINASQS